MKVTTYPFLATPETSPDKAKLAGSATESQAGNAETWTALAALFGQAFSSTAESPDSGASPAQSAMSIPAKAQALLQRDAFSSVLADIVDPAASAKTDQVVAASSGTDFPALSLDLPDSAAAESSTAGTPSEVVPAVVTPALPAIAPAESPATAGSPVVASPIARLSSPGTVVASLRATLSEQPPLSETPTLLPSSPDLASALPEGKSAALQLPATQQSPAEEFELQASTTATAMLVAQPVLNLATPVLATASEPATSGAVAAASATPVVLGESAEIEAPILGQQTVAIPDSTGISSRQELAFAVRLRSSDTPEVPARPLAAAATATAQSPAESRAAVSPVQATLASGQTGDRSPDREPAPRGTDSFRHSSAERTGATTPGISGATVEPSSQGTMPQGSAPHVPPSPVTTVPLQTASAETSAPVARAAYAAPLQPASEDAVAQPVRELSVRISDGTSRSADVRITDRAGEVQVSVRSADPGLTVNLRDGLSDLASRLDRHQVSSEIWQPATASTKPADSQSQSQGESRGNSQQDHNGQANSGNDGGQTPRRQQQASPDWLEEIETSFGTSYNR